MKLEINPNWTFNEIVNKIKTLRDEYNRFLTSFSVFEVKEKATFIHATRNQFYSLKKCLEWQIDRMWNYMNGFDSLSSIQLSAKRYK